MSEGPGEKIEQEKQEEIEIPTDFARAFGRGLSQSFAPHIQSLEEGFQDLTLSDTNEEDARKIIDSARIMKEFIDSLMHAESVKITGDIKRGLVDFKIVNAQETPVVIPQESIELKQSNVFLFVNALAHTINNQLAIVMGFSQLGAMANQGDKDIASKFEKANENANKIVDIVSPIMKTKRLSVATDSQGQTAIITNIQQSSQNNPTPSHT